MHALTSTATLGEGLIYAPFEPLSIRELALLPRSPMLLLRRVLPSLRNSLFRLMTGVSENGRAIFVVSVLFSTLYGAFSHRSGVILRFLRPLVAPVALFSAFFGCASSCGGGVPLDSLVDRLGLGATFSTVATGVEKVFIRRAIVAFFSDGGAGEAWGSGTIVAFAAAAFLDRVLVKANPSSSSS